MPITLRDITYTKDGKVVVNDMTNISTPQLTEYNFKFNPGLEETEPESTTILDILNTNKEWDVVSLRGKIISLNAQREVGSPWKRYKSKQWWPMRVIPFPAWTFGRTTLTKLRKVS